MLYRILLLLLFGSFISCGSATNYITNTKGSGGSGNGSKKRNTTKKPAASELVEVSLVEISKSMDILLLTNFLYRAITSKVEIGCLTSNADEILLSNCKFTNYYSGKFFLQRNKTSFSIKGILQQGKTTDSTQFHNFSVIGQIANEKTQSFKIQINCNSLDELAANKSYKFAALIDANLQNDKLLFAKKPQLKINKDISQFYDIEIDINSSKLSVDFLSRRLLGTFNLYIQQKDLVKTIKDGRLEIAAKDSGICDQISQKCLTYN